jgi:hypothetical protein
MNENKFKKFSNYLLEINNNINQITLSDSRYYKIEKKYYPSITHVLNYYPKGKAFEDWLKKVGFSSEFEVKRASQEGNQVHELIEKYFKGDTLHYLNDWDVPNYPVLVWQMFLRFVEWWETFKPKLIATEAFLWSDKLKIAGTVDLICKINDENWIVDFKTSNYKQNYWELQTCAYKTCYEEMTGNKIDKMGILWLKSNKRSYKENKMQGKNWEMIEPNRTYDENMKIFNAVKTLYDLENPKIDPSVRSFTTIVKKSH